MLCLLSGRYPFFRCYDDMTALAQLISLFGKQRIMACSKHLGKFFKDILSTFLWLPEDSLNISWVEITDVTKFYIW